MKIYALFLLLQLGNGQALCADNSGFEKKLNPEQQTDTLFHTWLALGDSYSIGESVTQTERFPEQTISLLEKQGIYFQKVAYIAKTGWTSKDLLNELTVVKPGTSHDVVTLLVGVNDQYQGMDTAGYRARFTQLLQLAVQLAGGKKNRVFVLSIPDYGVTPFGRTKFMASKEIDQFNIINKQITQMALISYTDITGISRMADREFIAEDGLHPSGKQYGQWAMALATAIRKSFH